MAFFGHRLSIPVSLAVLLVAVTWAGWENHRAAAVATRVGRSFWTDDEPPATAERIEKAIARLEQAVEGRPDDSDGHLHLARLWTQLSRVRSFEQLGGREASASEAAKLWDLTSMVAFHAVAHRTALQDDRDRLEQLRDLKGVQRCLLPALRHLVLARRACPILPETHVRLGEISFVRADPAADQVHLDRAKSLLAGHPDLLYRCGVLELQAGRLETACASWRTSLAGSDRYLPRILAAAGECKSASGTWCTVSCPNHRHRSCDWPATTVTCRSSQHSVTCSSTGPSSCRTGSTFPMTNSLTSRGRSV